MSVFNATTGENVTAEFHVNQETTDDQRSPSISALSNETFTVAWENNLQDGSLDGVYARVFNATTGESLNAEFRINQETTNVQEKPSICALSSDRFAIAWESDGQDGDSDGVYATVFGPPSSSPLIGLPRADDDDDDDDAEAIPFGNYYLLFAVLAIAVLIIIYKRKTILSKR